MKLSDLPDINFVDADVETVETIIFNLYKEQTDRTLAKGDPIRLFLLAITNIIVMLLNDINETGKQNLLKYATRDNLDQLGALLAVERIAATAATTTLTAVLSEARSISTTIPKGVRVTAGDNVFFATDVAAVINAGSISVEIPATCTTTGFIGNGYLAGELRTIVDPQPYVESMVNTTKSEGGAPVENDDSYREAIHEAPEQYSVAGAKEAYEYWAKRASALIQDVTVISQKAGEVEVYPLLIGGVIPESEMLSTVADTLNSAKVRPLTDKVTVKAPTVVNYDVNITFYTNADDAIDVEEAVNTAVNKYVEWQKAILGRDINPSELIHVVMATGVKRVAVTTPVMKVLSSNEIAIAGNITVNNGGSEDA